MRQSEPRVRGPLDLDVMRKRQKLSASSQVILLVVYFLVVWFEGRRGTFWQNLAPEIGIYLFTPFWVASFIWMIWEYRKTPKTLLLFIPLGILTGFIMFILGFAAWASASI